MKKLLGVLVVLVLLGLGVYFYMTAQYGPYGKGGIVELPKGSSVEQIARTLEEKDIIRNAWSFKLLVKFKKVQSKLQAGEYEFEPEMTTQEVLDKIVRGERLVYKLLIPEGYNFTQIAAAIEKAGIAPAAEVKKYFRDPAMLAQLGFPADSLEGYLYPATYDYERSTKLEALLGQMIKSFKQNFDTSLREAAMQRGLTVPQVVTLASIIEKETGLASERPLISSVFHNRLNIGMPLQTDPTVIYGLPNFDGNLRKQDLQNPHPYNTYVHVGLPPGPIASPGKASLKAAVEPATTNYLFFVSKKDNSHAFSSTLAEHEAMVKRYQLGQVPETMPVPEPTASKPVEPRPVKPEPQKPSEPFPAPSPYKPIMKPSPWPGAKLPQNTDAN